MSRKARADLRWGRGRRLVVVDLENIAGGPCRSEDCAAWVRRRLADAGVLRAGDHVTVAVDEGALPCVVWVWQGSVCRWGHGKDGADLALVDRGVRVVVAAHGISLSRCLADAASEVLLLSPREGRTSPVAA